MRSMPWRCPCGCGLRKPFITFCTTPTPRPACSCCCVCSFRAPRSPCRRPWCSVHSSSRRTSPARRCMLVEAFEAVCCCSWCVPLIVLCIVCFVLCHDTCSPVVHRRTLIACPSVYSCRAWPCWCARPTPCGCCFWQARSCSRSCSASAPSCKCSRHSEKTRVCAMQCILSIYSMSTS